MNTDTMKMDICGGYFGRSARGSKSAVMPDCADKNTPFNTFLHYSDPTAREERTVFGAAKKGLFYNYDDRLFGEKWSAGIDKAAKSAPLKSARYFEIALNHFHGVETVDLQHVILGCNMSNGYSYLIFGYTY